MAESASLDLTFEQAKQFVEQLSHEARAQLLLASTFTDIDIEMLEEPSLEVLNVGQLESGQKPQFICPHTGCESPFNPERMSAVAYHRRSEQPAVVSYGDLDADPVRGHIDFYNRGEDDGDEWSRTAFFCPNCARPIKLPAKWSFGSY